MKIMIQTILLLLGIAIAASAYALWANNLPWKEPPGIWTRLTIYLTKNVATTSEVAVTLIIFVIVVALGWNLQSVDPDRMTLTASVQTKWLKFTDDITIRLEPVSPKQTRLHIHSASRVGSADFGANLSHILRLYWNLG